MLTKVKRRAVLSAALFLVAGMMITTPSAFASSTSSDVFIVSSDVNAEVKTMELKAVNDGGVTKPVSGFVISPDNVVSVEQNGKVTIFSTFSLAFSGARISDIGGNPRIIPISTNGEVSFATLPAGVYTLDVIVDDRLAYESIVNIGQQPQQQVNQVINTVNQRTDVSVTTTFTCPVNSTLVNGTCVPSPSPIICPSNGTSTNQTCPIFPRPNSTIPLPNGTFPNGTIPTPNGTLPNGTIPIATLNSTEPTPPGTNATEPTPGTNATEPAPPGGGGGGGPNATESLVECGEGEQLAPDGLSCVPIQPGPPLGFAAPEPPIECPEGEQLTEDGLSCEPIVTEEPTPIECGEGEELIDGECQAIPIEEDTGDEEGGEDTGDSDEDEGSDDEGDSDG